MHPINWIKNPSLLPIGGAKFHYCLLVTLVLAVFTWSSQAQVTLNVQNFGAQGDAVQFYANTVSGSAEVTTTNIFSVADIGKTIQVFRLWSRDCVAPNCQDMITTIASVDATGTNITLNQICQRTLMGTFATVGTDNTTAFAATVEAAAGATNVIINIPNGTYLLMPVWRNNADGYAYAGICLKRGGLHFKGESRGGTVLLSRGAWQIKNTGNGTPYDGHSFRGFLFELVAPITNDYPLVFENMTWDGGVQQGNTSQHGFPVSPLDGAGWDEQHAAYLTFDSKSVSGSATHQVLTNLTVIHWRGEMIKSIDLNRNGNIAIQNCLFADGNATALNIYPTWDLRNNTFSNLFQIGEYYQQYYTNTAYFCDNVVMNVTGNGLAINGGTGTNPPFVIAGNIFSNMPANGILTTPGDNITITSNQFFNVNFPINIGSRGYQGSCCNSNIVISYNYMVNTAVPFQLGGASSTDQNRTVSTKIYGNTIDGMNGNLLTYGWVKDVQFYSNVVPSRLDEGGNGNNRATISAGSSDGLYVLVQTNNSYWTPRYDLNGKTNLIDYANGSRFQVIYGVKTNTVYYLSTNNFAQYPVGAAILITNSCIQQPGAGLPNDYFPVYLNPQLSGSPVVISNYQARVFYWNGSQWTTNIAGGNISLNTLTVNYGSGSGTYMPGQKIAITATSFTGKVFTRWTGATNILANPFAASTTATMHSNNWCTCHRQFHPVYTDPFNLRPLN